MVQSMRVAKTLILPLAAVALVAAGCSTSTNEDANNTSASPEDCSFDKSVAGVTAIQKVGEDPQLTIATDAKPPKGTNLKIIDLCPGTGVGTPITAQDVAEVGYVGVGYKSKKAFDSSFERGEPATFPLSQVISGWTEGVTGMQPGGARLLLIPPKLAYKKAGSPPAIQPKEALAFIVELNAINPAAPSPS